MYECIPLCFWVFFIKMSPLVFFLLHIHLVKLHHSLWESLFQGYLVVLKNSETWRKRERERLSVCESVCAAILKTWPDHMSLNSAFFHMYGSRAALFSDFFEPSCPPMCTTAGARVIICSEASAFLCSQLWSISSRFFRGLRCTAGLFIKTHKWPGRSLASRDW